MCGIDECVEDNYIRFHFNVRDVDFIPCVKAVTNIVYCKTERIET